VLAIARSYGHAVLVLGAWGCGAFANDPRRTVRDFRQVLEYDFRGAFAHIVFAITDWSPERRFLGPFREVFAAHDQAEGYPRGEMDRTWACSPLSVGCAPTSLRFPAATYSLSASISIRPVIEISSVSRMMYSLLRRIRLARAPRLIRTLVMGMLVTFSLKPALRAEILLENCIVLMSTDDSHAGDG